MTEIMPKDNEDPGIAGDGILQSLLYAFHAPRCSNDAAARKGETDGIWNLMADLGSSDRTGRAQTGRSSAGAAGLRADQWPVLFLRRRCGVRQDGAGVDATRFGCARPLSFNS